MSIHFDPSVYDNFLEGFMHEREVFEKMFGESIRIISIHRPGNFFLSHDGPIEGVEHTYQSKFFRGIKYVSDSQGVFRFGHPFEIKEFKLKRTIHMLIHPIWWICEGESNIEVLKKFIADRGLFCNRHVANNCIPYRRHLEEP